MKIIEWNLNFASDKNSVIPDFVKIHLSKIDAEIIMFTEVIMNDSFCKLIDDLNLVAYPSIDHNHNQVVIAVKKALLSRVTINQVDIHNNYNLSNFPDISHIKVLLNDTEYNFVATRIRILNSDSDDYLFRATQFKQLVKYLDTLNNVVLLGDFNNGMIKANSELNYDEVNENYKYAYIRTNNGMKKILNNLRYYNYHLMKKWLGSEYIMNEITGEPSSWGLRAINDNIDYGLIKNDQLISKKIEIKNSFYDWSFVKDNYSEYFEMLESKNNRVEHGSPDHAILIAEINID